MNIPEKINKLKLSHWQIASNGVWEEAKEIKTDTTDFQNIEKHIKNASKDVAIEAFFGDKQNDFIFFGVRIATLPVKEKIQFIRNLITNTDQNSTLENVLGIYEFDIKKTPSFMEIGAEGFWKSHGSFVVWKQEQDSVAEYETIQKQAPQIIAPFKRPMMLEFAWKKPLPTWLGIPVSEKTENGQYKFSNTLYNNLIS